MPKYTLTEGLADLKTMTARISKKQQTIMTYFARDAKLRDPHEADGGSKEYVRRERQAIHDLEERIVKIRSSIQDVNARTPLTVGTTTRTVMEWLNWRREVSAKSKAFLAQMAQTLAQVRQNAVRQGMTVTDKETYSPGDVVVMVNEQELARDIENMETVLGTLDGKLSLLNATTTIEVPD